MKRGMVDLQDPVESFALKSHKTKTLIFSKVCAQKEEMGKRIKKLEEENQELKRSQRYKELEKKIEMLEEENEKWKIGQKEIVNQSLQWKQRYEELDKNVKESKEENEVWKQSYQKLDKKVKELEEENEDWKLTYQELEKKVKKLEEKKSQVEVGKQNTEYYKVLQAQMILEWKSILFARVQNKMVQAKNNRLDWWKKKNSELGRLLHKCIAKVNVLEKQNKELVMQNKETPLPSPLPLPPPLQPLPLPPPITLPLPPPLTPLTPLTPTKQQTTNNTTALSVEYMKQVMGADLYEERRKFHELNRLRVCVSFERVMVDVMENIYQKEYKEKYSLATFLDFNKGSIEKKAELVKCILLSDFTAKYKDNHHIIKLDYAAACSYFMEHSDSYLRKVIRKLSRQQVATQMNQPKKSTKAIKSSQKLV